MLKYGVTAHATDRAVERLNIPREHAAHHLNQLMETAIEIDHTGNGIAYEHPKTKTRLILDKEKKLIITIYPHEHDDRVPRQAMLSDYYLLEALKIAFDERHRMLTKDLSDLELKRAEKMLEQATLKSRVFSAVTDSSKESIRIDYKYLSDDIMRLNREISLLTSKIQRMVNEIEKITCIDVEHPFTELESEVCV